MSEGREGDRASGAPSISADGRFVAFESRARNLVPGDKNRRTDVFVRDRSRALTIRLSVGNDGAEGRRDAEGASVSGDGRFVAFESRSSRLVGDDNNRREDVFLRATGLNRTPLPTDDGVTTDEDTAVDFDVVANDVDPDGDRLAIDPR